MVFILLLWTSNFSEMTFIEHMWIRSNNSIKQPLLAQSAYYTILITCSQMASIWTDDILLGMED